MNLLITEGAGFISSSVIRPIIANTRYRVVNVGKLSYAGNLESHEKELGRSPKEDLESGLREMIEWYIANRCWCNNVQDGSYPRERLGRPIREVS